MDLEAGGQIPRELSKNWKPGSQNQPESSRITDVSSRIIDEFEAWGSEWDLQKSFKKAVGSLGTGFGDFPRRNRSVSSNFKMACQNLKSNRSTNWNKIIENNRWDAFGMRLGMRLGCDWDQFGAILDQVCVWDAIGDASGINFGSIF